MFIVIKKKHIALVSLLIVAIILSGVIFSAVSRTEYVYTIPGSQYTVVIDAGHGGIDGGCVGDRTGVYESELNLTYAKTLAGTLNRMGISVVMTRVNSDGLYDSSASNLKRSEMLYRKKIIEESNADMVLSIHMNSFPIKSPRGAQVFYKKDSVIGENLASSLQTILHKDIPYAKRTAKVGDYYVLNCTDTPSALVECGFLSNPEEESLLQDKAYMEKFCYTLCCGIVDYLNSK